MKHYATSCGLPTNLSDEAAQVFSDMLALTTAAVQSGELSRKEQPMAVHAINEQLFRQVLLAHQLVNLLTHDEQVTRHGFCAEADFATEDYPTEAEAWGAYVDHIMRVAAMTPLVLDGPL